MSERRATFIPVGIVWILLAAASSFAEPALFQADLICPDCPSSSATLTTTEVAYLVVSTIVERGVSFLLIGATAAVGLPWLVAGIAIAIIYFPRWLKVS